MDDDPNKWLRDVISADFVQWHRIDEVLYAGRTKYQEVKIVRSREMGLCLVLDNKIQSTETEEFIYHEALVHPVMIAHPNPERVFIAGGGEGATLRDVLSHKTVKKAVMVDVDEEVVSLSRKYLPGHSKGAFEDPRAELHIADAREFLANSKDKFDIIIIDLPDPIEEGPAYLLYTQEFYRIVCDKLTENGLIAVQAGSGLITELLNFSAVYNTLKSVFPIVSPFKTELKCFGGPWGFCVASLKIAPEALSPIEIDKRISARGLKELRFYDGLTHQGIFSLPKFIRNTLMSQNRLITDKEPLYLSVATD
jgi:spermidine synthase